MNRPTARWILAMALLAIPGQGQVARQGEKSDQVPEDRQFESPMVLEIPWEPIARLSEHTRRQYPGLAEFWCEDAHLIGLSVGRGKTTKRAARFEVEGYVAVRDSFDRIAHVRAEIVERGRVITAARVRLDAEEEKSTPVRIRLEAATEAIDQLGDEAVLRITLTLEGNG